MAIFPPLRRSNSNTVRLMKWGNQWGRGVVAVPVSRKKRVTWRNQKPNNRSLTNVRNIPMANTVVQGVMAAIRKAENTRRKYQPQKKRMTGLLHVNNNVFWNARQNAW